MKDFNGPDCRFVDFKEGESVYVYYKLSGRTNDFWAGSVSFSPLISFNPDCFYHIISLNNILINMSYLPCLLSQKMLRQIFFYSPC